MTRTAQGVAEAERKNLETRSAIWMRSCFTANGLNFNLVDVGAFFIAGPLGVAPKAMTLRCLQGTKGKN
jgi:hypothetical protein